jgi:hypothetical protein
MLYDVALETPVQVMVTWALPGVAVTPVGASGPCEGPVELLPQLTTSDAATRLARTVPMSRVVRMSYTPLAKAGECGDDERYGDESNRATGQRTSQHVDSTAWIG